MLKLPGRNFKGTINNMLRVEKVNMLVEKIDNMKKKMGNVSKEMEILRKNKKKML